MNSDCFAFIDKKIEKKDGVSVIFLPNFLSRFKVIG